MQCYPRPMLLERADLCVWDLGYCLGYRQYRSYGYGFQIDRLYTEEVC